MWYLRTMNLCVIMIGLWSLNMVLAGTDDAKIVFCYGPGPSNQTYELGEANDILNHVQYDASRKILLYIHGLNETTLSLTVQKIIDAYTILDTFNILILDWSTLAAAVYPIAVINSNQLGPKIADVFIALFNQGMSSSNLHIVGHSLGAHLAGQIGRTITEKSNGLIKLQRISGLDPAFPEYYPSVLFAIVGAAQAINANDAVMVDIIHTDGGGYGTPFSTGSVDFWVNGGHRFQPGCPVGVYPLLSPQDLCSHQRSVTLWAESVSNPTSTFDATDIENESPPTHMGINCAMDTTPGNYELDTNDVSPYSE